MRLLLALSLFLYLLAARGDKRQKEPAGLTPAGSVVLRGYSTLRYWAEMLPAASMLTANSTPFLTARPDHTPSGVRDRPFTS